MSNTLLTLQRGGVYNRKMISIEISFLSILSSTVAVLVFIIIVIFGSPDRVSELQSFATSNYLYPWHFFPD